MLIMAYFSPFQPRHRGKLVRTAAQTGTALIQLSLSVSCSTETASDPPSPLDTAEFLDVHHADNLFIAVGTNSPGSDLDDLESYVISSSDGVSWEERYRAPGAILHAVTHGAGRWVAVGWASADDEGHRVEILTSEDGLAWNREPELDVEYLMDVVWTGESFVLAAGRTSSASEIVIFRSTDAVDWTEEASLPGDIGSKLVAMEGTVVAWGSTVSVSQDHGHTWSSVTGLTEGTWVSGLYFDGTRFRGSSELDCCFGEVPERIEYYAISSNDGQNWTETPRELNDVTLLGSAASEAAEVGCNWNHVFYRESGSAWSIAADGLFTDVTYAGDVFVAVGAWELKWSSEGKVWKDGVISDD